MPERNPRSVERSGVEVSFDKEENQVVVKYTDSLIVYADSLPQANRLLNLRSKLLYSAGGTALILNLGAASYGVTLVINSLQHSNNENLYFGGMLIISSVAGLNESLNILNKGHKIGKMAKKAEKIAGDADQEKIIF